jgi:hypothetical protein
MAYFILFLNSECSAVQGYLESAGCFEEGADLTMKKAKYIVEHERLEEYFETYDTNWSQRLLTF